MQAQTIAFTDKPKVVAAENYDKQQSISVVTNADSWLKTHRSNKIVGRITPKRDTGWQ